MTNKPKFDSIILPIIRRCMPNLIAQSIIGVQSMAGSFTNIFDFDYTTRLARLKSIATNNNVYRHFLRLNNRKKYISGRALDEAGYPSINLGDKIPYNCKDWCNDQFGQDAWLENSGVFWFRDEKDATLFRLTWL